MFLTCLNAMQCTCETATPNFTVDAIKIENVMMRSELNGEQAIIDILVKRSNAERQEISAEFQRLYELVNIYSVYLSYVFVLFRLIEIRGNDDLKLYI